MSLNQSFISDFSEYYRWSQRTKIKYKLHGETFYGRHTAQHQLQWSQIKIRNEKSNKNQKWFPQTQVPGPGVVFAKNTAGIGQGDRMYWLRKRFHAKCSNLGADDLLKIETCNSDWYCTNCKADCGLYSGAVLSIYKAVQSDGCEMWIHLSFVSALSHFGPESFRPGSFRSWVVSV